MVRYKRFTFLKKDTVLLRKLPTESQKAKALRNFSPRPCPGPCSATWAEALFSAAGVGSSLRHLSHKGSPQPCLAQAQLRIINNS